jgi:predicted nucleic acid-binding protein
MPIAATSVVVVDASVIVAALIDGGEAGEWAEAIVLDHDCVATQMAPAACANALRRLTAGGAITSREASVAVEQLAELRIDLYPFFPLTSRVWELRDTITCHDAWCVALAELGGYPLATLDARLTRASGTRCAFLTPAPKLRGSP